MGRILNNVNNNDLFVNSSQFIHNLLVIYNNNVNIAAKHCSLKPNGWRRAMWSTVYDPSITDYNNYDNDE